MIELETETVLSGSMIPAIAGAGALLMLLTVVIVFVQARKPKPAKAQGGEKHCKSHQKIIQFHSKLIHAILFLNYID